MKAKDLRGRNIEDMSEARADALENDSSDPKEDDDAVAAAYENISKRLESIRGGRASDEEGSDEAKGSEESGNDEPELTEWKGPRPPKKEELRPMKDDEDDQDLRKVKLNNLEDEPKNKEEDEEEVDPLDDEEEKVTKAAKETDVKEDEHNWEPAENDPLDDEDEEDEPKSKMRDEEEADEERLMEREETAVADDEPEADMPISARGREEMDTVHSEMRRPEVSEASDMPEDRTRFVKEDDEEEDTRGQGPDSLEDLTENKGRAFFSDENKGRAFFSDENGDDEFSEDSKGIREEEELPYRKAATEGDDDYSIPSLKGSRQTGAHMDYNANPQRESFGQSYSPRGNMDGNDPNNFFSSHQNQAPKRANKFHLLVLVIIGIAVIGFTVYVLKGGFGGINLGTSTQASPSPTPAAATPEPTPTPTPEPEVERGNYTVKVLNGTSTSGLAAKVRDALKEKGYKTSAPGNAEDNDVAQTEIRVKEGSESAQLFERLKLDLAPDYDAKQGEALDSKSKDDAEVIVGAK